MEAIDRTQLDAIAKGGCSNPKCHHKHEDGPLFITQKCHPDSAMECYYYKGVLTVSCVTCRKPVVAIKVDEGGGR